MTASKISKGIIKDIIIVGIGVLAIWIGLQIIFGTDNPFYVVSSGSMIPELEIFDVLVVEGNTPFEEIKIGDIIVFDKPSGQERVIVHRVVSIINDDPFTIRTKGDANPASISGTDFPVTKEEYIGQVLYVIPQVGYITKILNPPVNYIIIAVIIGFMIFKQISKSKKQKELLFDSPSNSDTDSSQESQTKWEDLDIIPKDSAYTNLENGVKKDEVEKKDNAEQIEPKSDNESESEDSERKN
ncbi:MAG: Peptidase S26B, signal peptidase [Nitrosopumilales archaeon]|nr:MAG: Peptidase S26B, signal peptidase [Nitrosopumilales archaeon]